MRRLDFARKDQIVSFQTQQDNVNDFLPGWNKIALPAEQHMSSAMLIMFLIIQPKKFQSST